LRPQRTPSQQLPMRQRPQGISSGRQSAPSLGQRAEQLRAVHQSRKRCGAPRRGYRGGKLLSTRWALLSADARAML